MDLSRPETDSQRILNSSNLSFPISQDRDFSLPFSSPVLHSACIVSVLYFTQRMSKLNGRSSAVIFWVTQSLKKMTARNYKLAGFFICLLVVGFFALMPVRVYAVDCTDPKVPNVPPGCTVAAPTGTPPPAGAAAPTSAAPAAAPTPGTPTILDKIVMLVAGFILDLAIIISKLVITLLELLIPIMTYNNFANNPVVDSGWAILRDTVNMFFVIVLIVIAFATIFGDKLGAQKFQWQQQLTKLMIFAVVINFSRTLCGLMIDFGQVIMLTFANAIREIAAGNFVQMFGMGDIYSLSKQNAAMQSAATDSTAPPISAFDFLAAAIMSMVMMFIVLIVMVMLLVLLLYRIVMLWILITVSPLTWFIGGTQGLIKSDAYSQWWAKFKCLVVMGPILTFFLWLTLVVAGSGDVSSTAGFNTPVSGNTAGGFLTSIFEMPKLISFIVSIALLWAGFDATNSACAAGLPGIGKPGDFVKGGVTKSLNTVKGIGAKVGGRVGRNIGGLVKDQALKSYGNSGMRDRIEAGKEKYHQTMANRPGIKPEDKMKHLAAADKIAGAKAARVADAGDTFKGLSAGSKNTILQDAAKKGFAKTKDGREKEMAQYLEASKDPKVMEEMRRNGTAAKFEKEYGKEIDTRSKGDKGLSARRDAFKKENPGLTGSWGDIKTQADAARMSADELAHPDARKNLEGIDSRFDRPKKDIEAAKAKGETLSEKLSVAEAIDAGKMFGGANSDQTKAFKGGQGAMLDGLKPDQLARVTPDVLTSALAGGTMSAALLEKSMGGGKTVADTVLQNRGEESEKAIRATLDYNGKPGDPNHERSAAARDSLLKSMGISADGKGNSKAMAAALTANIGLLPDMMDHAQSDEQKKALADALATSGVMKSAVSAIRQTPKTFEGAAKRESLRNRMTETLGSTGAGKDFAAQMASMAKTEARAEKIGAIKSATVNTVSAGAGAVKGVARDSVKGVGDMAVSGVKGVGSFGADVGRAIGDTKAGKVGIAVVGGTASVGAAVGGYAATKAKAATAAVGRMPDAALDYAAAKAKKMEAAATGRPDTEEEIEQKLSDRLKAAGPSDKKVQKVAGSVDEQISLSQQSGKQQAEINAYNQRIAQLEAGMGAEGGSAKQDAKSASEIVGLEQKRAKVEEKKAKIDELRSQADVVNAPDVARREAERQSFAAQQEASSPSGQARSQEASMSASDADMRAQGEAMRERAAEQREANRIAQETQRNEQIAATAAAAQAENSRKASRSPQQVQYEDLRTQYDAASPEQRAVLRPQIEKLEEEI